MTWNIQRQQPTNNMTDTKRSGFGSKLGMVLATAGSAVGLGNVWRFPYVTGQNGGAAFIIIYIVCILLMAIPVMLCEMMIGRHGQSNAARAYGKVSGSKRWRWVGYLGVFTGTLIVGYYSVVSGWTLQYTLSSLLNDLHGTPEYFKDFFNSFIASPTRIVGWTLLLILITHLVIIRGVEGGIEKAAKVMMPVLFVLLVVLVVCSVMLPGAGKGLEFLFWPDFSKVTGETFLEAMGQAFFSLSIGMGALCTYASYFQRDTHLVRTTAQIAGIDTGVAIMSGLIIFPAAMSVGIQPDSGPSLVFVTLPNVIEQAFASVPAIGYIVSVAFYLLLFIAALTSNISVHEVGTSFVSEEFHMSRRNAARVVSLICVVVGSLCALSLCGYPWLSFFGKALFDLCDWMTANVLLTLGGLFTSILVGWVLPRKLIVEEMTNWGTLRSRYLPFFLICVRYVAPICIVLIFLHQFGVI
jgi:NSS family neurotransmitter:Na+ symporter